MVHLRDTGLRTNTGGRIKHLESLLSGERFLVTYGDGLANVDLQELVRFHLAQGRVATLTAVRPPARFGVIRFEDDRVASFAEKTTAGDEWINGGFMVFEPDVRDGASNEIREQYLSAERARKMLGWAPLYDLDEGLREPISWYRRVFEA